MSTREEFINRVEAAIERDGPAVVWDRITAGVAEDVQTMLLGAPGDGYPAPASNVVLVPVPPVQEPVYGAERVPVAGHPEGSRPACELCHDGAVIYCDRCGPGISEMPCDDCVTYCRCGESHYPECER